MPVSKLNFELPFGFIEVSLFNNLISWEDTLAILWIPVDLKSPMRSTDDTRALPWAKPLSKLFCLKDTSLWRSILATSDIFIVLSETLQANGLRIYFLAGGIGAMTLANSDYFVTWLQLFTLLGVLI